MAEKVEVAAKEYAAFMKKLDDWGKTLPAREQVILNALVAAAAAGGTWGRLPDGTWGQISDGAWGRLPDGTWGRV